jgi:hypothetical protein
MQGRVLHRWSLAVALLAFAGCLERRSDESTSGLKSGLASSDGALTASIQVNSWGAGYCANVTVTNTTSSNRSNWYVGIDLAGTTVTNLWSATLKASGSQQIASPVSYNVILYAQSQADFGFCGSGSGKPAITSVGLAGEDAGADAGIRDAGQGGGVDAGGSGKDAGTPDSGQGPVDAGGADAGGPGKDAGASDSGQGSVDAGGVSDGGSSGTPVYSLAGIRRLCRAEIEKAATALVGVSAAELAASLGADTRQAGFTRNSNERVSAVQGEALWNAADALATQAVNQRLSQLAPCSSQAWETCAKTFIHSFAASAFRRTTTSAEEANLLTVYRTGSTSPSVSSASSAYSNGIQLVISAVLQSPSFLYATELGTSGSSGTTRLTGEEIATSLSLLLTGRPADDALMSQGRSGALDSAGGRESAARALLRPTSGSPSADVKAQVERLVLEWVGSDSIDTVAKDTTIYPDWYTVRKDMLSESQQIVDAIVFSGDGKISSLLTTDSTYLTTALAQYYGVSGSGKVTQPPYRRGLMLAGAFVAANSYPAVTAPVKRGATVRRRLLCEELSPPTNLGTITVPAPDPTLTTRERFTAHSSSAACSGCHKKLDPPGFALEVFDTGGRYRSTENGKTIDASGDLIQTNGADGHFSNAVEMMQLLANATAVSQCFDRQLYRFASGRAGGDEERTFFDFVKNRTSALQGSVIDVLIDYVQSDSFVIRRLQ